MAAVEKGLRQGGVGIGFPVGYYTGVSSGEIAEVASLAKRYDSFILTHVRYLAQIPPSAFLGVEEMLAVAESNDIPLVVQHVPSNCLALTGETLTFLNAARRHGIQIGTEFYPYMKGSSFIGADYLAPGFQERMGMDYSDITMVATGETLTKETYEKYRKEEPVRSDDHASHQGSRHVEGLCRPLCVRGCRRDGLHRRKWQASPMGCALLGRTCSSASAGTHAKVLRLVREKKVIPLMLAVAKLSYFQAKFLEGMVPSMRYRGRIQPARSRTSRSLIPTPSRTTATTPLEKAACRRLESRTSSLTARLWSKTRRCSKASIRGNPFALKFVKSSI